MKKNEFILKVKDREYKFESFHDLYSFMDYEVSVYDLDNMKVYCNDHYLGTSPTDIANKESYKRWMYE